MTAVEWLYLELWKQNDFSLPSNLLEQAKEMEKKQIIDAFDEGCSEHTIFGVDYYKLTFKSE